MGKHEASKHRSNSDSNSFGRQRARKLASHALHPLTHIIALVSMHVVALGILEKSPLLTLLFLH